MTVSQTQQRASSAVLAILSAAMFIYVIDTTLMNVSISALVEDLNTNVGAVQAAITLYTLTMAAFIPQIGVLLKTRRCGALSVPSNVLNMTASISLFGYALLRDDVIFVITMGFQLAAAIVILVLNIRYRDKPE